MEHVLRLHNKPFNSIKSGQKTIEMRLYDEKRKLLKIGDTIRFINRLNSEELVTVIENLYRFDSFKEIYNSFNKTMLGYNEDEVAHFSDMEEFYPIEEQKQNGVIAIKIKVIK